MPATGVPKGPRSGPGIPARSPLVRTGAFLLAAILVGLMAFNLWFLGVLFS